MKWPVVNKDYHEQGSSSSDSDFVAKFTKVPFHLASWTENAGYLTQKRVLDFCCSTGETACGIAFFHDPAEIFAVDFHTPGSNLLSRITANTAATELPKNLHFKQLGPTIDLPPGEFDFIYSWSKFELIEKSLLPLIIGKFYDSLSLGGRVLIQLGRPYYSPLGGHLVECGISNWEHLTLPLSELKQRVMTGNSFSDAKRIAIWERFERLNKITAEQLTSLFSGAGFHLAKSYVQKTTDLPPKQLIDVYQKDKILENQYVLLFVKA